MGSVNRARAPNKPEAELEIRTINPLDQTVTSGSATRMPALPSEVLAHHTGMSVATDRIPTLSANCLNSCPARRPRIANLLQTLRRETLLQIRFVPVRSFPRAQNRFLNKPRRS